MGFDVAIYNTGCRDGKKVVDSIKAAYLYADKVRVYDFFPMLDSIQEHLLKLAQINKERYEKDYLIISKLAKIENDKMLSEELIIALNSLSSDELDRLDNAIDHNNERKIFSIIAHHYSQAWMINEARKQYGKIYNIENYLRDLKRMEAELIQPTFSVESTYPEIPPIYVFNDKFFNDHGFKMFNSPLDTLFDVVPSYTILTPTILSESAISSLPGFPEATVDEIIDLRKELDKYIIPYRSAILKFAKTIKEVPDTKSLQSECAYLYLQEIEPKVNEINAAIRDNNVFKNIAKSVITEKETWVGVGALIAGLATSADIASAVSMGTAVMMGGLSVSKGITKTMEENKKIKENEMYFLYEAGKKLREQKDAKGLGFPYMSQLFN